MNYGNPNTASQGEAPGQDIELRPIYEETNLVPRIKKKKDGEARLIEIGEQCRIGFEADLDSRSAWEDDIEDWMGLAKQLRESKSYPWPNASNIKYPLISVAAIQFSARAYPSLVPSDGKIVKTRVIGKDPTGEKGKAANRIGEFMSWQIMHDMDMWEEEFDKLLITLSIVGCMFKKTFFNPSKQKVESKVVDSKNLVVNHWARSLEEAERISEIIYYYKREVDNRMRAGIWEKEDIPKPSLLEDQGIDDGAVPYEFIEQHTWIDLDDDDFEEPYVVTFERYSGKVVRISPRYDAMSIIMYNDKIAEIKPYSYYTKYPFIPNPDGGFYDIGFGHLLGPINESINTLINQLVDAGTLSNLQSGFLGKGLRIKGGDVEFSPGEWKFVNSTIDDLKKQIFPLPVREPSKTLFELFGALVTAGKELASVAEIFTGKMPGQNTPATTTMATIEQGMKVYTAVYKRVFKALEKEFKKVFELNNLYLDTDTIVNILDTEVDPSDFDSKKYDVCPTADPTATTQQEKLLKAQALVEQLPLGILNPVEVQIRLLQAQEQPNWEKLIPGMQETGQPQIPQKPDPALLEMQMKAQSEQMMNNAKIQQMEREAQMNQRSKEFELKMKEAEHAQKMKHEAEIQKLRAAAELHKQNIFIRQKETQIAADKLKAASDLQIQHEKGKAAVKKESSNERTSKSRK